MRSVAPRQLACDPCRRRKVRCDKLSPCSNCKASNIPCQSTKERSGKRRRVHKGKLEQTIADLNEKVERLSQHLGPSAQSPNPPAFNTEILLTPSTSQHEIPNSPRESLRNNDRSSNFEGESSFFTHSKQATQAFQASLASTPYLQVDEALSGAVERLHSVLNHPAIQVPAATQPTQSSHQSGSDAISALPMPPSDMVIRLLRHVKGRPIYNVVFRWNAVDAHQASLVAISRNFPQ